MRKIRMCVSADKTFAEGFEEYILDCKSRNLRTSNVHYIEMAKMMEAVGVQTIIYTDISKDGMLSGVNGEQLDAINRAVGCGIIASGGVKSIADIELCKQLNLYGVICGKSIYSGSLSLAEAVAKAGAQTC